MPREAIDSKVVVMWAPYGAKAMQDLADRGVNLLVCREGVRVFKKNEIDGRAGNPTLFRTVEEGFQDAVNKGAGPGNPFAVTARAAKAAGVLEGEHLVVMS